MKTIRVGYTGFWQGFDYKKYAIHNILSKHYKVEVCDNPDYLFFSVFNPSFSASDKIRIGYVGENLSPDFNLADYAISFENIVYGDRHIRVPNWIMNPKYQMDIDKMMHKHESKEVQKKGFCSFVVSNGSADPIRTKFFELLSSYRKVSSGGKYMNNIGMPQGVEDKYAFQCAHKFSLSFENSTHPGYTTEKIVEAFAAQTVPIYWGDPDIERVFNKNAFVNVGKYDSLEEAVSDIIKIDQDDELYRDMLLEPALVNMDYVTNIQMDLEAFLLHIIEQSTDSAYRRNCGGWAEDYFDKILDQQKTKKKSFFRRR